MNRRYRLSEAGRQVAVASERLDFIAVELHRLERAVRSSRPLPRAEMAAALRLLSDAAKRPL